MIAGGKELGGVYGHSEPYHLFARSEPYSLSSLGGLGGAYIMPGSNERNYGGLGGAHYTVDLKKAIPIGLLAAYILGYMIWKKKMRKRKSKSWY
jgi:hypothetical protein